MADLGFLPAVRRLLDQTPRGGQRMLFSATLDSGVNVLVKRFLVDPAVHEADSAQSPVATMDHHVLHVQHDQRVPVLVDLTSAPGRTVVFTRTKHGAKNLARQLNARGVPAVELHGNLAQNARTRNMEAFHSGRATTLVATDIAARGIHVDDVALVVHADPPAEHKAYLHRSGRTARAGAAGTVITLMTDSQVKDVRDLTRAAKIHPTTTRVSGPGHALLQQLAPGERVLVEGGLKDERPAAQAGGGGRGGNGGNGGNGSGDGRRRGGGRRGGQGGGSSQGQSGQGGQRGGRPPRRTPRAGRAAAVAARAAAAVAARPPAAAATAPPRSAPAVAAAADPAAAHPSSTSTPGRPRPSGGRCVPGQPRRREGRPRGRESRPRRRVWTPRRRVWTPRRLVCVVHLSWRTVHVGPAVPARRCLASETSPGPGRGDEEEA